MFPLVRLRLGVEPDSLCTGCSSWYDSFGFFSGHVRR